jgi:hypothetical protein
VVRRTAFHDIIRLIRRADLLSLVVTRRRSRDVNESYRTLVEGLRASSVSAYFQRPDQLVISRQHGAVLPSEGNSFWVSHQEGSWYLCTWAPICYRVPPGLDLVRLCVEFVDYGRAAQWRVPSLLLEKYRLVELTDEEAGQLLGL